MGNEIGLYVLYPRFWRRAVYMYYRLAKWAIG